MLEVMKNYPLRVLGLPMLLFMFILGNCARKDAETARTMAKDYWNLVLSGQTRKAYRCLTLESRRHWSYKRYFEHVSWVNEGEAIADSFWAVYWPLTKIQIGNVRLSGDSAWVDMVLVYPDVSERVVSFTLKADSLFGIEDSLARRRWILEQVTQALKDRNYRPFVHYLTKLPLHWEWGGWRLVYK